MEDSIKVSKTHGITKGEIQDVSLNMKNYIKTQNETHLTEIANKVNNRPGLLGVLFPTAIQKEHGKLTVQRMRELFKSQSELLNVYTNAQLELAKKQADFIIQHEVLKYKGELVHMGIKIQKELTTKASEGIDYMTTEFEKSKASEGEKLLRQYEEAKRYEHIPHLHKNVIQSLENETEVFFKAIDILLNGFIDALTTKIGNNSSEI